MKKIIFVVLVIFGFLFPNNAFAQGSVNPNAIKNGYVIDSFISTIEINADTSFSVEEKIVANFYSPKHGIIRVIPKIYSSKGKTINSKVNVLSISDETGNPYKYQISNLRQSIELKIGDPDKTMTGEETYLIKYEVKNILLAYDEGPEVYWNVAGREWDTNINYISAKVVSKFAGTRDAKCFVGSYKSTNDNCTYN